MILWFSGTGNSADVASRLASLTADRTVRLSPSLTDITLDPAEKRVVWVFPVHSWGVPPFVRQRIELIRFHGPVVTHHMVATCGDDAGMTDRMWRADMHRAGHQTGAAFTVIMPNTYVAMKGFDVDAPDLAARKLAESKEAVESIASQLPAIESRGEQYTQVIRGAFPRLKTSVIYPWFMRYAIRPSKFKVADVCVECGRCERICPTANICRPDGRPAWGEACTGCLACYHICPANAISYGSATKGKGHYVNPAVNSQ
ncbi:MAG: EFR1 family ferrodoxin [Muribaculaceae bacterium]|nr:EFR1 family ferrodoxin [Muribaculaceae bacterium]